MLPEQRKELSSKDVKLDGISFDRFQTEIARKATINLQALVAQASKQNRQTATKNDPGVDDLQILTTGIKKLVTADHTSYVFQIKQVIGEKTFQNLTIEENSTGIIAFLTTYTPTAEWLAKRKNNPYEPFDGTARVKKVDPPSGAIIAKSGKNTHVNQLYW